MNAEIFAEWLRRQGYKVTQTSTSYWYEANPRVYQAFPYHSVIQPGEEELSTLLRQNQAIALRYSTPIDNPLGCISYHAVIDQPGYALEKLDRRSRQNIRSGLKNCTVETISLERLAEEGWALESDTADRQQREICLESGDLAPEIHGCRGSPWFRSLGGSGRRPSGRIACRFSMRRLLRAHISTMPPGFSEHPRK